MRELCSLLADAFTVHGYTVSQEASLEGRSGTVYIVPLLAEGERAVILDAYLEGHLAARTVEDLRAIAEDVGADLAVLCHLGESDAASRAAAGGRVVLWGRSELVRILGDARLAAAVGAPPAPLPLDPTAEAVEIPAAVSDLMPLAFQQPEPVPAPSAAPTPPPDLDLGAIPDLAAALDLSALAAAAAPEPATPIPPSPATAPSAPDILIMPPRARPTESFAELPPHAVGPKPPAFPLLPVRITPEEATRKVRDRLYGVERYELVLQPVHLYDYECDVLREGSLRYETEDGRIQVNGSDKAVAEVDPDVANPDGRTLLASIAGFEVTEKVLRIPEERARQHALDAILARHTRSVEVKLPDHEVGVMVTERRKVAPRPEHVRLKHLGAFHRVVWRLWGGNGQVDMDALDGKVLLETLRTAPPDAMMLD